MATVAESRLLKLWSGRAAGRRETKRPLVLAGSTVSLLARPPIALAQSWTHVFAVRVVKRVGMGIHLAIGAAGARGAERCDRQCGL